MTDQELKDLVTGLAVAQAKTDAQMAKTDAQLAKTDKQIKELGKQIGGLGNKFGSFTEGLAYPSLQKVLKKYYHIENTSARFEKVISPTKTFEFDVFGYTNGKHNNAVVVEVKSHLTSANILEMEQELKEFKIYFPEFGDKNLYGILAVVQTISQDLKQLIYERGLHLAIIHNEIFDFKLNPKGINFNA